MSSLSTAWREALALWDAHVTLSPPVAYTPGKRRKSDWPDNEPLAYINMVSRQIVVNFDLMTQLDIEHCLTAVLAHEIGHHVRYPHTLSLAASLQVLEQRMIPNIAQSLSNLFFDLQVNAFVGRTHQQALCDVYRAFAARDNAGSSPVFSFYLAIYEELWALEPGSLMPPDAPPSMDAAFPSWRGEARMFAQTFYALSDVYLQFVYFCSRFVRYVGEPSGLSFQIPLSADLPRPDEDDFASAIVGSKLIDDALADAASRGWIDPAKAQGIGSSGAFEGLGRLFGAGHGAGAAAFRKAVFSKHYKRLVDAHLLDAPLADEQPEPDVFLPTVTEAWEPGEDPRRIDWVQSVIYAGAMASAMPLMREHEPDDPPELLQRFPALEIYVDTSGSMPNPTHGLNVMTLSGLVLAASALRKEGKVRGAIYSWGDPITSEWMYAEEKALDFFMHFAGGGTQFPWPTLEAWAEDGEASVRVIISDSGLIWDLDVEGAQDTLKLALDKSERVVLLVWLWSEQYRDQLVEKLGPLAEHPHLSLAIVLDLTDMTRTARDLGRALFGELA